MGGGGGGEVAHAGKKQTNKQTSYLAGDAVPQVGYQVDLWLFRISKRPKKGKRVRKFPFLEVLGDAENVLELFPFWWGKQKIRRK